MGKEYELSAIQDYLNTKLVGIDITFYKPDVKKYLLDEFGDDINFTYTDAYHKYMMVFILASSKTYQLAKVIRSISPMKVCTSLIRESLN